MGVLVLRSSSVAGGGSWVDTVGLLWSDGIEPSGSETTLFPLQTGRVWYVDFDAGSNGNGSSGSPYWSFTELNAGTAPSYAAGDHIYVSGNATAAKSNPGTRDMQLNWTNAARFGTAANPTVIRSKPGSAQCVFNGSYTAPVGVVVDPSTNDGNRGIVVINIRVTRCNSSGNVVFGAGANNAGIKYQRIISCQFDFNYSLNGGPNSSYGGPLVVARGTASDIEVRNCLTFNNNTSDGSTVQDDTNCGGINILFEAGGSGSTVKVYSNRQYNEHLAIRHKHDGAPSTFEAYYNYIDTATHYFWVRNSTANNIHHNLCRDGRQSYSAFIVQDAQNQSAIRTNTPYNNTVSNIARFISDGDDAFTFNDVVNAYLNIHYMPSASLEVVVLGTYSDRNYYTAGASFDNNCLFGGNTTSYWLNNGTTKTRTQFNTQFGTDNIYTDPLFTNAAANDFTLQAGSPCRNINGTGLTAGAL